MKKVELPWEEQAAVFLEKQFLPRARGQAFLVEQFRASAEKNGVSMPANPCSWGRFIRVMRENGLVRQVGFGLDQYGSPKSMWKAVT